MNGEYRIGDVVLGNWTLIRLLGEGSYGKVYEAHREDFGTTYTAAIKIMTIPPNRSEILSARAEGMDEESVSSYFRSFVEDVVKEFALMSRLKGTANIVSYEDHAVIPHSDGIGWDILIRMELLTPMLNYMSEHTMTRSDIIKLGVDMCRALELCQRYNIIHRDIKPANIFISETGDYKLGDFGVARTLEKTTGGLSKKGTYTYMAPEIYRDEKYGSTVDIYSLGIVLYRLLNNNRAPFLPPPPASIRHSERERALVRRISGEALPAPANAEGRLAEIVLKACAYDPKDRYSSPLQMRQELEAIQYARGEDAAIYGRSEQIRVDRSAYTNRSEQGRAGTDTFTQEGKNEGKNLDATVHDTMSMRRENSTPGSGGRADGKEESRAVTDAEERAEKPEKEEKRKDSGIARGGGRKGSGKALILCLCVLALAAAGWLGVRALKKGGEGGSTQLAEGIKTAVFSGKEETLSAEWDGFSLTLRRLDESRIRAEIVDPRPAQTDAGTSWVLRLDFTTDDFLDVNSNLMEAFYEKNGVHLWTDSREPDRYFNTVHYHAGEDTGMRWASVKGADVDVAREGDRYSFELPLADFEGLSWETISGAELMLQDEQGNGTGYYAENWKEEPVSEEPEETPAENEAEASAGRVELSRPPMSAASLKEAILSYRRFLDADAYHTVALRRNGTVAVALSDLTHSGQDEVGDWRDICAVEAAEYWTFGIRSDGTVLSTGKDRYGSGEMVSETEKWTDIVRLDCSGGTHWDQEDHAVSSYHVLGLKYDGTVVAAGDNDEGQCDVENWSGIIDVSCGYRHSLGLRADGTVVAVGSNKNHQCEVSGWTDIVQIAAGKYCSVGLRADGTVVIAGGGGQDGTGISRTEIKKLQNIRRIFVMIELGANEEIFFAVDADGVVHGLGGWSTEAAASADNALIAVGSSWGYFAYLTKTGEVWSDNFYYSKDSEAEGDRYGKPLWTDIMVPAV